MHRLSLAPAHLAQAQAHLTGLKCQGLECERADCDLGPKRVFARSELVLPGGLRSYGRRPPEARQSPKPLQLGRGMRGS
jgi:hypothetical protein